MKAPKATFRMTLIASAAALAFAAPGAFAQESDPVAETPPTAMETPLAVPAIEPAPAQDTYLETDQAQDVMDKAVDADTAEAEPEDAPASMAQDEPETTTDMAATPEDETVQTAAMGDMYIDTPVANIRTGAGLGHEVTTQKASGEKVAVYATEGNWSRISAEGEAPMWIYTPLLSDSRSESAITVQQASVADVDAPAISTQDLNARTLEAMNAEDPAEGPVAEGDTDADDDWSPSEAGADVMAESGFDYPVDTPVVEDPMTEDTTDVGPEEMTTDQSAY